MPRKSPEAEAEPTINSLADVVVAPIITDGLVVEASAEAEVAGFSPENVATVITEAPEGPVVAAEASVPYEGPKPGTVEEFDNGLTLTTL